MLFSQSLAMPGAFWLPNVANGDTKLYPFVLGSSRSPKYRMFCRTHSHSHSHSHSNFIGPSLGHRGRNLEFGPCFSVSRTSDSNSDPDPSSEQKVKPKPKSRQEKTRKPKNEGENPEKTFPTTIPRKPRRGRRSEATAVEDFVRDSLERTFESIRQQNAGAFADKENVIKERKDEMVDPDDSDSDDEDEGGDVKGKKPVIEEDDPEWPADAEVGWGVRASEYFEQHPIKNVVGEDGVEIDWEGEMEESWVKEINCLEWESFAFHPSPLVVLVFERYNRAADNWKALQELEKASKVYWSAKDRLPPRTVKLDINIETDLAYALKVREGPQILFFRGNKFLYREKEIRTSEELVQMIAHFYYNAKKPSWIESNFLGPRNPRSG